MTSTVSSGARLRSLTPLRTVLTGSTKAACSNGTPSGMRTTPPLETTKSITRMYSANPPPDGHNGTGHLVAEYARRGVGAKVDLLEVSPADTAGSNFDQ